MLPVESLLPAQAKQFWKRLNEMSHIYQVLKAYVLLQKIKSLEKMNIRLH